MEVGDDSTLVRREFCGQGIRFFSALLVTFILLTIGWLGVADPYVINKVPSTFSASEKNLSGIYKAMVTPDARIAFVGSSLTNVLPVQYVTSGKAINLGIDGGSVVTALHLLLANPGSIRTVLVETNVLDRPIDLPLINSVRAAVSSRIAALFLGAIRPLRYLLSKPFLRYDSAETRAKRDAAARERLLSMPPAHYETVDAYAVLSNWDTRKRSTLSGENAREIMALVKKMEAMGMSVYFINIPFSPIFESHEYARRAREIVAGNESYRCARCIDLKTLVDASQLRWSDGMHVDLRSGILLIEALDHRLEHF